MKKTIWTEEAIRNEIRKLDAKTGLSGADLPIYICKKLQKKALGAFVHNEEQICFAFSRFYFDDPNFLDEEAINVIRHEYAHYMKHVLYGPRRRSQRMHDEEWIICCNEIGAIPVTRYDRTRYEYYRQKHATEERVSEQLEAYQAGDLIIHPEFGKGVIREITGAGSKRNAVIDFRNHETTKLFGLRWIDENCRRIERPERVVIRENSQDDSRDDFRGDSRDDSVDIGREEPAA